MIPTTNKKQGLNQKVRFAKPPFTEWCKLVRYLWCKRKVPNKTNMVLESLIRALKSSDGAKDSENVWNLLRDLLECIKKNNEKIVIKSTLLDCLNENLDGKFSLLVLECISLLFDVISRNCLTGLFDQIGKILCKTVDKDDKFIEKLVHFQLLSQRHKGINIIIDFICSILKIILNEENVNCKILDYITNTIISLQFKDAILQQSKLAVVIKFKDTLLNGKFINKLFGRLSKEFCEKYSNRKNQEEFLSILYNVIFKRIKSGHENDLECLISLLNTYKTYEIIPDFSELWKTALKLDKSSNWFSLANVLYELDHSKINLNDVLNCFEPNNNSFDSEYNFLFSIITIQSKLRRLPKFFATLLELNDLDSYCLKYLGKKLEESTSNICIDCWKVCLSNKDSLTISCIKLLSTIVEHFVISEKLFLKNTNRKLIEILEETRSRLEEEFKSEQISFNLGLRLLYCITNFQFLLHTTLDISYQPVLKKEKFDFSFSRVDLPWNNIKKKCINDIDGCTILGNFSMLKTHISKYFRMNNNEKIIKNAIEFLHEITIELNKKTNDRNNELSRNIENNVNLIYPYMSTEMKEELCETVVSNMNKIIISKLFEFQEFHSILFTKLVQNLIDSFKSKKVFQVWIDFSRRILNVDNSSIKDLSQDIIQLFKMKIKDNPQPDESMIISLGETVNLLLEFPFESLETKLKLKFSLICLLYSTVPLDKGDDDSLFFSSLKGFIKTLDTRDPSDLWKYLPWNQVVEYLQKRFLMVDYYSVNSLKLLKQVFNGLIISLLKSDNILRSKQIKEFFENQISSINKLKDTKTSDWTLVTNYTVVELFLAKTLSFSKRNYLKGEKKNICTEFYENFSSQLLKIVFEIVKKGKCTNYIDWLMNILSICLQSKDASKYGKIVWELSQKYQPEAVAGTIKYLKCLCLRKGEFEISDDWLIENWLKIVNLIANDLKVIGKETEISIDNLKGILGGLPKENMLTVVQHILHNTSLQTSKTFQLQLLQKFLNKEKSIITTTSPSIVAFLEFCSNGNPGDHIEILKFCTIIISKLVKQELGSRILRIIEVILESHRSTDFYLLSCRSIQLAISGNNAPPYLIINTLSSILEKLMKENTNTVLNCREEFEKTCALLSKPNFLRVSVQLVTTYCIQGGSPTGLMSNAIYHVMDLLEGKDMGLLRTNLPPAALTLFLSLNEEFERNFRYMGKV